MDRIHTVKGACHIHSRYSGDGEMELSEIKDLMMSEGFEFLAISEHEHDMDARTFDRLIEDCLRLSEARFLLIPGIEFNCHQNHILGIGIQSYADGGHEDATIDRIKAAGGVAIWAHPRKTRYRLPPHLVVQLDGMEIWNSKFDGKYAPQPEVVRYYARQQERQPGLRAFCCIDLHFRRQFRSLSIYCEVERFSADAIVRSLRDGRFAAKTGLLTVQSDGAIASSVPGLQVLNAVNMQVWGACKSVYRGLRRRHIGLPVPVKNLGRRLLS